MQTPNNDQKINYIVGIGASAGGLEALQILLSALPANTGFPYIIVQHLSRDYKSLLCQILGKYTKMPIVQAENDMEIEPDHVYIIQPGKMMTLSKGRIHYTDQIPKELNFPVDAFFRSLAEEAGANAIAIILSGTGSDGTNGIKAIKENDGLVIVQDLESSKFDGMPRSAIRTGLVDAQIKPEEIALELEHIAGITARTADKCQEEDIDADLIKRVYAILKKVSGINFTYYKQSTIIRRMERRMMLTHKDGLQEYVDFLYMTPKEVRILSKEVLIGVTNFFRDPESFQSLKEKVIPKILNHSTPDEPIRVWVAGCSTGEEAYSIAIVFSEVMEALSIKRIVKVFATDLDEESINTAGKGVYGANIVDSVSPVRLSRYFTRRNNTYTINRDIRKMIIFSPHNVFQDPPFSRLNLISCRNMLIYFQPVLQNALFTLFHQSLKNDAYLFLGKSESIGSFSEAFPVIDPAARLFGHRRDIIITGAKKVPFIQASYIEDEFEHEHTEYYSRAAVHGETGYSEKDTINTRLLQKFMPPSIVVNEKNELMHSYGEISNYVHFAIGKFSNNLFDILTEGLKTPVSTLLRESREKGHEVQYTGIHFKGEQKYSVIDLTVMPVSADKKDEAGLFAIIFVSSGGQPEIAPDSAAYDIDKVASRRISDLEQELTALQVSLDRSVAEQECVNEELQAANEELLTGNEELQSSNEELQSVNEELYTVNSEYQQKLAELNDLNDDIANFLTSTLTGIIFVDTHLNIRRYTDYVTSEFSVMNHDIGRSLDFISYHFPSIDITEICTNVLKTLVPEKLEVTTKRGKSFFMRVAPYRSTENKISGCVITLMDITTQKQSQTTLQSTEKQLYMAQQASDAKSDYLTHIAHEIRTPMSSLIMLSMRAKKQSSDQAALNADLDKIADTVNYMTSIVTDISEASISERLSGGQAIESFALRDVLDNVATMLEPNVQQTHVTLEMTMDDVLNPKYVGNKMKLQQILINFLNNSIRYTKPGGSISLRAFEEPDCGDKARVYFEISDTGIGIRKDHLNMLYTPFTKEYVNDENQANNTGLGLSIAYNLIASMNGDVTVTSEEDAGNTFLINIMLDRYVESEDDADDKFLVPAPMQYNLSGCNVLIAEDNNLNRTLLEAMLAKDGISFTSTVDGEEVVRTFTDAPEHTYACILMDIRMPKLDGIMATTAIRASGKADAKAIPIIAISANSLADDIRKARESGLDDFVAKPIDRDCLMSAISKLIKRGK